MITNNNNNNNNNNSFQFQFVNVPSQQPDGQLHKQHNVQTQITTDNKQDTNKRNKQRKEYLNN